ncbi:hypothetical protein JCM1393_08130 [Clostridium carnis]
MKKRFLSIIITTLLSFSVLVSCSNNITANEKNNYSKEEITIDANADLKKENNKEENNNKVSNNNEVSNNKNSNNAPIENDSFTTEDSIKKSFENSLTNLYKNDYSIEKNKDLAKEFIKKNFTENGTEKINERIKEYNSKLDFSDLTITGIKEIKNIDGNKYLNTYEIRYNITVIDEKPSIYSDIIGVVVTDKSGQVLIDSINQGNF